MTGLFTNEDCFLFSSASGDSDHLDIPALHRLADVVEGDEASVGGGQAVQEPDVVIQRRELRSQDVIFEFVA